METKMTRTEKIINHIEANELLFSSKVDRAEITDLGVNSNRRYLVKVYLYSRRAKEYVLSYTFTNKQYLDWFERDFTKSYPQAVLKEC